MGVRKASEVEINVSNAKDKETNTQTSGDKSEEEYPQPKTKFDKLRRKIFILFEEPTSSRPALAINVTVLLVVFISTITFLTTSLPQYWNDTPPTINVIEAVCIAVFTTDYGIRALTCPHWKWFFRPLNLVDLFAILPYFIEMGISGSVKSLAVIRVIRLIRIFRIMKVGKYTSIFRVISKSLVKSKDGLLMLVGLLSIAMLILSTLMFFAETTEQKFDQSTLTWMRKDGSESPFQSIPGTFWWCLVTMTTVGYGDAFPISPTGKFVAVLTMLIGIMVLAFPISIIGSSFSETYTEHKNEMERKSRIKISLKEKTTDNDKDPVQSPREKQIQMRKTVAKIHLRQSKLAEKLKDLADQIQEAQQQWEEMSNLLDLLPSTTVAFDDDSDSQEMNCVVVASGTEKPLEDVNSEELHVINNK